MTKHTTQAATSGGTTREAKQVLKALMASVEKCDHEKSRNSYSCDAFLRLFQPDKSMGTADDAIAPGLTSKQFQSLVFATVSSMQKNTAKRFFSGLCSVLESIISEEAYVPASAFVGEDENENANHSHDEIVADVESTECLHFIKYAAMCVSAYLQTRIAQAKEKRLSIGMQIQVLAEVYDVAATLHNILLSLHTCGPESTNSQNAVLAMCAAWWFANASSRDALIAQCLPILVLQTLEADFHNSHMTKLYKLRDAFRVIDFTNPSSDSLRQLLLRATSNPRCLRMQEGRKFIAFLFQETDLIKDLHMAIRAQIPDAKPTVLKCYGEIYHRAWKNAADSPIIRDEIEHHALQDLMYAAIHVSSTETARSILAVLEPLHDDKKTPAVAGLLYRSYGPIVWRSLAAANPLVRKNAVVVLEQVFPLNDPRENHMKEAVSRATDALKRSLQDKDPRVRVAGCDATASICALFWEALPASEIRILLKHIVMELASDGSSSAVRAAALDATSTLLKAGQSHAVLRGLLPCLGNMIHDKAEKVRLAACRMLAQIKKTPGIKFYHVVPVDHLTARLAEESRMHNDPRNGVAYGLTSLLLNSYFPQGENSSATLQVQRTMSFLISDPRAASVFYANLADLLDPEAVTKFICMLLACLTGAVDEEHTLEVKGAKTGKKRRRRPANREETTQQDQHNFSASNLPLMASLAETIAVLLESVLSNVRDEKYLCCKEQLVSRFVESDIINILMYFEQKGLNSATSSDRRRSVENDGFRTCAGILRCVKALPNRATDRILSFVSDSMRTIHRGDEYSLALVSSHLSLLCSWGMTDEVAALLAASIESAFSDDRTNFLSPISDLEKPLRSSRACLSHAREVNIFEALVFPVQILRPIIDAILEGKNPSSAAIRESIVDSVVATTAVDTALGQGPVFAERMLVADPTIGRTLKESEIEFILWSCEAYGRFALHREAQKRDEIRLNEQAKKLLTWSTDHVVPALVGAQSGESELRDIMNLSRISNVSESLIMPDSPSVASPPRQRANLSRTPEQMSRRSLTPFETTSWNDPDVFLVSSAARALLQSSCVVVAEFLAVGGLCGEEVANTAVNWFKLLHEGSDDIGEEKPVQEDMLPVFIRLAIQLCKSSASFTLLKEIFKCAEHSIGKHSALLTKGVVSLLKYSCSQDSLTVNGVVNAFLEVVDETLAFEDVVPTTEPAQELHGVWDYPVGCVATVLKGILSVRCASLVLVQSLVSRIGSYSGETMAKSSFDIKCLRYIMTSRGNIAAACRPITSQLDLSRFDLDNNMHISLEKILKSNS
eukprot:CAMPEP_0117012226 /NCGR_PEP_ID=MMETSP0472-20121206/10337_1 /TAXON_ID=693140 ORGANISM="Tiarina fusus, Strain LIS" /NCGR_SAMPLE_ID=MMETSP0472 /ASSEMBLY_ACC=CAM_ASM_000603 /LENGTH=1300 /DNA_ID=CAMNT_0004715245 /DNA_START=89 /DNA_END=3991 /DNA_ORIENTATION=+